MNRRNRILAALVLAAGLLVAPLNAQTGGGGTGGTGGGQTGGGGGGVGAGAGGGGGQGTPWGASNTNAAGSATNLGTALGGPTNTTTGRGAGAGGTTSVPTVTNPFQTYYGSPLAASYATNNGKPAVKAFGQPRFTTPNTQNTGNTGASSTHAAGYGFSTIGVLRHSPYTTELGTDTIPSIIYPSARVQYDAASVLQRSTMVNTSGVQVVVEGENQIRLSGQVGTDKQRRLAENMLRLSPAARGRVIVNNIAVPGSPAISPSAPE